jgi:GNAT superfamily N-acetyltransferase
MDEMFRIKQYPVYPDLTFMQNLQFRQAVIEDLSDIIRMLADDFLGQQRECLEDPLPESYIKAFREIDADPNNELIVAILSSPPYEGGVAALRGQGGSLSDEPVSDAERDVRVPEIIGTFQLIYIPSLSFQGGKRCTVESVRVDDKFRGQGIGREMMLWAIERAKERGCISMYLTSHNERKDAHRFYENLGFKHSHVGMKRML